MKPYIYAIMAVSLAGCATTTPRRNFTGLEYPSTFSTIYTDSSSQYSQIKITKVDDYSTGYPQPTIVDVSPGSRRVIVETSALGKPGSYYARVDIPCREHVMYRVTLERNDRPSSTNIMAIMNPELLVGFDTAMELDGNIFTNINSVLAHWRAVPVLLDMPDWFSIRSNRVAFLNTVDEKIQNLTVSSSDKLIQAINQLLVIAISFKGSRVPTEAEFAFKVYESSSSKALVQSAALYYKPVQSTPAPSYANYQPYIYTPPPQVYKQPQIYIPPPVSAPSYRPPTSTYNSPAFRLNR